MKQKYFLLSTVVIMALCLVFMPKKGHIESYEDFLQDHKFHPSNYWNVNVEEIPKQDRPDLAWQQNYLMTMDPFLKRPAPERLATARARMKAHFENTKSRTGTQEFPWIERGPDNVGGRTRAIAWDPNDTEGKKVWAGGVTGGLWYTDDIYNTESTWNKVDDFWANISITSIAFDPTNMTTVYVGTGEGFGGGAARGAGIWKSTDGGTTWAQLSSSVEIYYVNDLIVRDESGTGVLYAGTRGNYYEGEWHALDNQGLLRSADGGTSFTQVMPLIPGGNIPYAISDIELAADNSLWVGTSTNAYNADNRGGGSILHSSDGTTWTLSTQRTDGIRVELACAPSNANVVYALIEAGGKVNEVIKTTNAGTSWASLAEPADADEGIPDDDFSRGQAWYDLILGVDPNDEDVVLAGGIDLFKSSDGGSSWKQISHWWGDGFPNVHADQHAIVFKPGSSTDVVFGHDGGIDLSTNINTAAPSFTNRNNNYNVTQFYACAIHPEAGKDYFLGGTQDNGTQQFDGPGLVSTAEATGGDGAFCFIDQQDGDYQITSYVYNSYYLSTNGGTSFTGFIADQNTGQFINPSDYDDHLGILYTAANASSIGRFNNIRSGNPSRSDIDVALGEIASHLRVSPHTTSSTTLFVGTIAGRLFKITNANTTPSVEEITGDNFSAGNISRVEIGATENDLLVTFSNYGVTSVFESGDGGTTWTSKEGDLPDMPVRWALYNPGNYSEVILATDLGVWRTTNMESGTVNWVPSNIGLANVRVDMLQIRESDYEVIAATHGRGLYSSSGFIADGIRANFSASATEVLMNEAITFTAKTANAVSWSWSFEGGTPSTSTVENPTIEYSSLGFFDVSLTVTDSEGNEDTKTLDDFINVIEAYTGPCSGEKVLTAASGTIEDGSGSDNYQNNQDCTWTIQPPNATSITLSFVDFDLEVDYDFLYIYDGEDQTNPVHTLTGSTLPEDITITSSSVVVTFTSDELLTESGWKINYASESSATVPASPSALAGEGVSFDQVDLSWTDNSDNETAFVVERSEDNNNFSEIQTTDADITAFSDTQVAPATTYYYRVKAVNGALESAYSNVAEITSGEDPTPSDPSDLEANAVSFSQVDLTWADHSDNETAFVIERSEDNNSFTEIETTDAGSIAFSDAQVTPATTYYYRVKAVNGGIESAYSNVAEATTPQMLPDLMPEDFTVEPAVTTFETSIVIQNSGDADLNAGAEVAYYLSDNDLLDDTDIYLQESTLGSIPAGESEAVTASIEIPAGVGTGEYFIFAVADEENAVVEKDETNNQSEAGFDFTVLGVTKMKYSLFRVFPVPVKDELHIESLKSYKGYSYRLVDVSGKTILAGNLEKEVFELNTSALKNGTYQLILRNQNETQVFRVLKN